MIWVSTSSEPHRSWLSARLKSSTRPSARPVTGTCRRCGRAACRWARPSRRRCTRCTHYSLSRFNPYRCNPYHCSRCRCRRRRRWLSSWRSPLLICGAIPRWQGTKLNVLCRWYSQPFFATTAWWRPRFESTVYNVHLKPKFYWRNLEQFFLLMFHTYIYKLTVCLCWWTIS